MIRSRVLLIIAPSPDIDRYRDCDIASPTGIAAHDGDRETDDVGSRTAAGRDLRFEARPGNSEAGLNPSAMPFVAGFNVVPFSTDGREAAAARVSDQQQQVGSQSEHLSAAKSRCVCSSVCNLQEPLEITNE